MTAAATDSERVSPLPEPSSSDPRISLPTAPLPDDPSVYSTFDPALRHSFLPPLPTSTPIPPSSTAPSTSATSGLTPPDPPLEIPMSDTIPPVAAPSPDVTTTEPPPRPPKDDGCILRRWPVVGALVVGVIVIAAVVWAVMR